MIRNEKLKLKLMSSLETDLNEIKQRIQIDFNL